MVRVADEYDERVYLSVCLSLCLRVCVSVRVHISETTHPIFTVFFGMISFTVARS